jgi:UDPglucose 6-dehydrogenase
MALAGNAKSLTVCVLGATFKPNTDDLRGSQALELVRELLDSGANVQLHDPVALEKITIQHEGFHKFESARDAILGSQVVVLATEWNEYLEIDPNSFTNGLEVRRLLDLRNALDKNAWAASGWQILSILPQKPLEGQAD